MCQIYCIIILIDTNFLTVLDAPPSHPSTVYDLIANVTHESVAGTARDKEHTVWKVHLRAGGGGGDGEKWFQIQDLIVEETRKEMIFLGETVLQVSGWESKFPSALCLSDGFGIQVWERRADSSGSKTNGNSMDVDGQ